MILSAAAPKPLPPVASPVAAASVVPANQDIVSATTWLDTNFGEGSHQDLLFKIAKGEKEVDNPSLLGPIIQALIEKGADVDRRDKDERTALMKAAQSGHTKIVRVLLEAGADLESKNKALMFAVMGGHKEIVKVLIEVGAEISNKENQCPLSFENIYEIGDPCVLSKSRNSTVYSKSYLEQCDNVNPITKEHFWDADIIELSRLRTPKQQQDAATRIQALQRGYVVRQQSATELEAQ